MYKKQNTKNTKQQKYQKDTQGKCEAESDR